VAAILLVYAERKLSHLVVGDLGESFSTKIYSSPKKITGGEPFGFNEFQARIARLGYEKVFDYPLEVGEYLVRDKKITIYLRSFDTQLDQQQNYTVQIDFFDPQHILIEPYDEVNNSDIEKTQIEFFFLEPELIAELSGPSRVRRDPAEFSDFPPHLINAVVAVEDSRFFGHWGIDPVGIARAFVHNISGKKGTQGGSTITQQLAKNFFLSPKRTLRRKMAEALLAFYLELKYSKEEIITLYLNHIYLGQDGPVGIAGMRSASQYFFGERLENISLSESAMLAGLIRSPYRYNPTTHPQNAKARRDFVLKRMQDGNYISHADYLESIQTPLTTNQRRDNKTNRSEFDYAVSEVIRQMGPLYGDDILFRYGLRIHTTIDPMFQSWSYAPIQKVPYQGALVAVDPNSGGILAMQGGRDFKESQFNRVTQAHRQPGSAFKPFVYGAALEQGIRVSDFIHDTPLIFEKKDGTIWAPKNFSDVYLGTVTVRNAIEFSINLATIDLAKKLGPSSIRSFAKRMGIQSPLGNDLSLALGAYEVTPLELATAYAPFINGGFSVTPHLVRCVLDSQNEVLELNIYRKKSVLDPAVGFLVTSMLQGVIQEGTARNLNSLEWQIESSAGKTGTTNDGKDGWFIGYTKELVVGVWTGHDEAKPVWASGSRSAVPVWAQFMNAVYAETEPASFAVPKGIVQVEIDPHSGKLRRSGCPETVKEWYIRGTEPHEKCHLHEGGIKGFFKKLFGKSKN
jgi:penicillin-binding protein 1B